MVIRNDIREGNDFFSPRNVHFQAERGNTPEEQASPLHATHSEFRGCGRCRGDGSITMAAIVIFSSSVAYKYKSRIYSCASIIALLFIALALLTPLFVISNAGGKEKRSRYFRYLRARNIS